MTAMLTRGSARRYVLDANALISFFEERQRVAEKVRDLLVGGLAAGFAPADLARQPGVKSSTLRADATVKRRAREAEASSRRLGKRYRSIRCQGTRSSRQRVYSGPLNNDGVSFSSSL